MDIGAKSELEQMVALLNEKVFGRPDESRRLKLKLHKLHDHPDLDGVLAFIDLTYNCETAVRNAVMMPIPPVTLCWGSGTTADSACETAIRKFAAGSDLIREYLPFTAGSLEELKLKLAVLRGEGRPA